MPTDTFKLNSAGSPVAQVLVGDPNGAHFIAAMPLKAAQKRDLTLAKDIDMTGTPKIPFTLMLIVRQYFIKIRDNYATESFVFIHRNRDTNEYIAVVPGGYKAGAASVDYCATCDQFCQNCHIAVVRGSYGATCPYCGMDDWSAPLNVVGTIHSHVDMAPFHSGTDDHNELSHTGLHFTLGHMKTGLFGSELSAVVASEGYTDAAGKGTRFSLSDEDIFELPFTKSDTDRLNFWLTRVAFDKHLVKAVTQNAALHIVKVGGIPCFSGTKEQCGAFASGCTLDTVVSSAKEPTPVHTFGGSTGSNYGWSNYPARPWHNFDDDEDPIWGGKQGKRPKSLPPKQTPKKHKPHTSASPPFTANTEILQFCVNFSVDGSISSTSLYELPALPGGGRKYVVLDSISELRRHVAQQPPASARLSSTYTKEKEALVLQRVVSTLTFLSEDLDDLGLRMTEVIDLASLVAPWSVLTDIVTQMSVDGQTRLDRHLDQASLPSEFQETLDKLDKDATSLIALDIEIYSESAVDFVYMMPWLCTTIGCILNSDSLRTAGLECLEAVERLGDKEFPDPFTDSDDSADADIPNIKVETSTNSIVPIGVGVTPDDSTL
jgi:hypothetical protein